MSAYNCNCSFEGFKLCLLRHVSSIAAGDMSHVTMDNGVVKVKGDSFRLPFLLFLSSKMGDM